MPCLCPLQLGVLGSGTYGLVVRARDTSDPDAQDVAIKLLPRGGFVSRCSMRCGAHIAWQTVTFAQLARTCWHRGR